MLFTNVTQLAVLGLVLIVGLVLGLLIAPKGTKWREREALTTNRDAYVRDLEAENARLKAERPS